MELDRIEKLMEKYFEATTTVAEEEKLKEYFTKEGVAPHLEQYKPMFAFFSEARTEQFNRQVPLIEPVNVPGTITVRYEKTDTGEDCELNTDNFETYLDWLLETDVIVCEEYGWLATTYSFTIEKEETNMITIKG